MPRVIRAEFVLIAVWAFVLFRFARPEWAPEAVGAGLMALYLALAIPGLRRRTAILCAILAALTGGLLVLSGGIGVLVSALDGATVFGAFFGTLMTLRATAGQRRETAQARSVFQRLSPDQQSGAFLTGAYLIGSVLVVGAMAILAPVQDEDAPDAERRAGAEASLRGMCLAPLWSPFWIAMAVSYQYLPTVPLWQVLAIGIPLALAGLVLSHFMYTSGLGAAALWDAVRGLAPIAAPVAVCAIVIVLVTSSTTLSTLQAVIICTPVLCASALLAAGARSLWTAIRNIGSGLGNVGDELVLVTISLALGRVLERTLSEVGLTGWIGGLGLPQESFLAIIIFVMTGAALIGIHQLVSITVLLVVFVPLSDGIAPVILMEAGLIGWAFASMVGITAVSVLTAASMFRTPIEGLTYGANLKFVVAFGILATGLLIAVNRIVF
jgi:hypothetical protein